MENEKYIQILNFLKSSLPIICKKIYYSDDCGDCKNYPWCTAKERLPKAKKEIEYLTENFNPKRLIEALVELSPSVCNYLFTHENCGSCGYFMFCEYREVLNKFRKEIESNKKQTKRNKNE